MNNIAAVVVSFGLRLWPMDKCNLRVREHPSRTSPHEGDGNHNGDIWEYGEGSKL